MFHDIHIRFAVRDYKKTRKCSWTIKYKENHCTHNNRIDPWYCNETQYSVKEHTLSIRMIKTTVSDCTKNILRAAYLRNKQIFSKFNQIFPTYQRSFFFFSFILPLFRPKLSNNERIETQTWKRRRRRRILRTQRRRKRGKIRNVHKKVVLIPSNISWLFRITAVIRENTQSAHATRFIRGSNYSDYPLHRTFVGFDSTSSFPPANYGTHNDTRFYIESAIINSTHEDVSPPLTGIKVISMKRKYIIGRGGGGAISFSIVSISIDFSFQSATILIIVGIMGICLFESDEHSFDTRYDLKLKWKKKMLC